MKLSKLFLWLWGVLLMQPQFNIMATGIESSTSVTFCAPESNIYPFFMMENGVLTGINPDMMRQIFNEGSLPGVNLKYVRRPWKRCKAELENGTVDMMISGFDAEYSNIVYPSALGFNLNDSIISTASLCFASITGKQMDKVRSGIAKGTPFKVGVAAGFSKEHSSQITPVWKEMFNPEDKYRMLETGRVDAIIHVCAMDDYPIETKAKLLGFTEFETIFPPYLSNPAFVVFSKKFSNKHKVLAKQIISVSLTIDKVEVYKRYKPKS